MADPAPAEVVRDPEIQGGTAVFSGTRVPVGVMLDYLRDGQSVDDFLSHYPGVTREQAIAALEEMDRLLSVAAG
ncbi:MAG: DUF433 domain-containing protein [Chloroflexi bacterium]|nr:DUF433 domain-containing protein [Chloroflexota bacterium]